MPVAESFMHRDSGNGTHVHTSSGASIGGPEPNASVLGPGASTVVSSPVPPPPHAARITMQSRLATLMGRDHSPGSPAGPSEYRRRTAPRRSHDAMGAWYAPSA